MATEDTFHRYDAWKTQSDAEGRDLEGDASFVEPPPRCPDCRNTGMLRDDLTYCACDIGVARLRHLADSIRCSKCHSTGRLNALSFCSCAVGLARMRTECRNGDGDD